MKVQKFGRTAMAAAVFSAIGIWSGPASANPFVLGDIFASAGTSVKHYNSAGTLLETLNTGVSGVTTGSAFDSAGNLYVTNFGAGSVTKFAGPGDAHTASLAPYSNAGNEAILFLANGNVLVGGTGNGGIIEYTAAGAVVKTILPGVRVDWFDVAADQNTILYTQEGNAVRKATISGGVDTGVFANVGDFALRILPNGEVLVAADATVERLSSTGVDLMSYDIAGDQRWFALNLDPNGTSFWTGDIPSGNVYKFDIAAGGAPLQSFNVSGGGSFYGLSLYGEITVSNPPPTDTPEPATLLLLAPGLLGLALGRRRKKK